MICVENGWTLDRPTGLTADGNSLKIAMYISELL